MSAAVVVSVAAVTPAFTVGALTEQIADELGTNVADLGLALACFFGFTALGSFPSGRLADRLGAAPQLATAAVCAGTLMISLGFVSSFVVLSALLAAGGLANSLVAPAAGNVLGSTVSAKRLSLASGMVQAALAAPPLTAGLLVRFVAGPFGWRTAFLAGGVLVILSALPSLLARTKKIPDKEGSSYGGGDTAPDTLPETRSGRVLALWALGAGLGTVAVTATASFFVPVATSSGFPAATAGLLGLVAGGLAAAVRVGTGLLADLRPRANVAAAAGMMLVGCGGLVAMTLETPVAFLAGVLLLVTGLWGWNGLLVAAAIRLLPGRSGRAVGGLQVGFFAGATAAPVLFGVVSTAAGFGGALLVVAASAIAGAGVLVTGELYRRLGEDDTFRS